MSATDSTANQSFARWSRQRPDNFISDFSKVYNPDKRRNLATNRTGSTNDRDMHVLIFDKVLHHFVEVTITSD